MASSPGVDLHQEVYKHLSFTAYQLLSWLIRALFTASSSEPHSQLIRASFSASISFRSSWLTMIPHDPRSLRPTERQLQVKVLMAHHETSRSVIIMANRKVASASSPHGSP